MSFRRTRFHKDGKWVTARSFPFLRAVLLWLQDFAPEGPLFHNYCWLDIVQPIIEQTGCYVYGHGWIIAHDPNPVCRWCNRQQQKVIL